MKEGMPPGQSLGSVVKVGSLRLRWRIPGVAIVADGNSDDDDDDDDDDWYFDRSGLYSEQMNNPMNPFLGSNAR
jgi:hypothetical protein